MKLEDIIFKKSGSKISMDDISNVEKHLKIIFPDDYKQFLLRHNGARSKRCVLEGSNEEIVLWPCITNSTKLPIYSILKANQNIADAEPGFRGRYCFIAETLCNIAILMKME